VETIADEDEQDDEFARTMIIDSSQAAVREAAMATATRAAVATRPVQSTGDTTTASAIGHKLPGSIPSFRKILHAKIQVLNGKFAGREVDLNKALTTLGSPGAQVIAITKRSDAHYIVLVENKKSEPPNINGIPLGSQALKLNDNDVIEVIGIKMGFFTD
jgi:hypothetical protein